MLLHKPLLSTSFSRGQKDDASQQEGNYVRKSIIPNPPSLDNLLTQQSQNLSSSQNQRGDINDFHLLQDFNVTDDINRAENDERNFAGSSSLEKSLKDNNGFTNSIRNAKRRLFDDEKEESRNTQKEEVLKRQFSGKLKNTWLSIYFPLSTKYMNLKNTMWIDWSIIKHWSKYIVNIFLRSAPDIIY